MLRVGVVGVRLIGQPLLCIRPFKPRKGVEYGCGQCLPCRINKRRVWTARLVLEALCHEKSCFFTLTYAPDQLPAGGTLVPGHLEQFRYRLRYQVGPFRYFMVGEYGDRTFRPHYHGACFGVDADTSLLDSAWRRGHTHVGRLTIESAAYVGGYVTKKMTRSDDERLDGRHPEFARMSRRPGIGFGALNAIAEWLYTEQGSKWLLDQRDVNKSVRFGGKIYPLGRYLVSKLREQVDMPPNDPLRSLKQQLRGAAENVPELLKAREFKRENDYRRSQAYVKLRRSLGKL